MEQYYINLTYKTIITSLIIDLYRRNLLSIDLFFDDLRFERVTQQRTYTAASFLSKIRQLYYYR